MFATMKILSTRNLHFSTTLLATLYTLNIQVGKSGESRNTKGLINQAFCKNGGAKRDRTVDLYAASVALSQLSYGPVTFGKAVLPVLKSGAFRHSRVSLST